MSGLGDVPIRRVTLDYLKKNLSARTDESFTGLVTFTSCATDLDSVSPASLYVPPASESSIDDLKKAVSKGAYGVLLPESQRSAVSTARLGIPVLFATGIQHKLGNVAAYMEGDPSESLAVFAVFGQGCEKVAAKLATLLHILGNPVGLVSSQKAYSLNRGLDVKFPLNAVQLQHIEAVGLEDGVAALVIAADEQTLDPNALIGTQLDVCADTAVAGAAAALDSDADDSSQELPTPNFGASPLPQTHVVKAGMFHSELGQIADSVHLSDSTSRVSIAMALAAGITASSIEQAVQVSEEFS